MKFDLRVTIPGNQPISEYCHPQIDRFPGHNSRKSAGSLNKKHYKTLKKIGNILLFTIAGYRHLEIGQFPGYNSRKSADFRILLLGNRYEKNLIS